MESGEETVRSRLVGREMGLVEVEGAREGGGQG